MCALSSGGMTAFEPQLSESVNFSAVGEGNGQPLKRQLAASGQTSKMDITHV